jgi:hypothetical protein
MTQPPAHNEPAGAVIDTLREHTRRTARLLGYLDDLRGRASTVVGGLDVAELLAHFSERLRAEDGQVQRLVARLEDQ